MTSLIGNRELDGSIGFTLLEVLVATAILSFGLTLIYQSFFISLDSSDYYLNHLRVQLYLTEKIWQLEDKFRRDDIFNPTETEGTFMVGDRDFSWNMDYNQIETEELYKVNLNISWQQGSRRIHMSRVFYVSNFTPE